MQNPICVELWLGFATQSGARARSHGGMNETRAIGKYISGHVTYKCHRSSCTSSKILSYQEAYASVFVSYRLT